MSGLQFAQKRSGAVMKKISTVAVAILTMCSLTALSACGTSGQQNSAKQVATPGADNTPVQIVASINQWGTVATELGGKYVHVSTIMNSTNVEAHDYEPTVKDIAQFKDAKIVVVNGADYDAWAIKASKDSSGSVVNAAKIANIKEGANPHVWFSAKVRTMAADAITANLKKIDPKHAVDYDKMNTAWHKREKDIEQQIRSVKNKFNDVTYAATESVAYYLASDMGFEDVTPKGYVAASANESEPTPADIREFQDAIHADRVHILVFNTQEADDISNKIVSLAEKANIPVVRLTEQMPSQYHDLLDWMQALVNKFTMAIEKR